MVTRSVLLAEDDLPVMIGLKEILEDAGWKVSAAKDGAEALALYKKEPTDIVLTDLLMPKLDGLGLLTELRSEHPDIQVVMLTGFGTVDRCRDALRAGACDFVQKPCEEKVLLRVLDRAYERVSESKLLEDVSKESVHSFSLSVPADIGRRAALSNKIMTVADATGFRNRRWDIRLAFDEAFTNAVIHGAMSDPSQKISVSGEFAGEKGSITITDPGRGFNPDKHTDAINDMPGGRGLFLLRSFCDEVEWAGNGNTCTMTFFMKKPSHAKN